MQQQIDVIKVGKKGTFVLPSYLREQYGIHEGSLMIPEPTEDGIILKPATVMPVEVYTAQRRAEFILSNAVDEHEYNDAVREVQDMGLEPATIPHSKWDATDAPAVS